jgi:hypothetical protein
MLFKITEIIRNEISGSEIIKFIFNFPVKKLQIPSVSELEKFLRIYTYYSFNNYFNEMSGRNNEGCIFIASLDYNRKFDLDNRIEIENFGIYLYTRLYWH